MFYIDPTTHRLSEHFLLSDFMGCDSVYRGLCRNRISTQEMQKVKEAEHLCTTLLEPALEEKGSLSISYGYISPELSRTIVKYQNPNKPSYHRWDLGAASDVVFHDQVNEGIPPVHTAIDIENSVPEYARILTYSESPYMCLATSTTERNRRAFYENRYEGVTKAKPNFITYPKGEANRTKRKEQTLRNDLSGWEGKGYPTYHGGGRRQNHHIRISEYSMLSDYLYNKNAVHFGLYNVPEDGVIDMIRKAGDVYDTLVREFGRMSIIRAYESDQVDQKTKRGFCSQWVLNITPPYSVVLDDVGAFLDSIAVKNSVRKRSILVWGD